MESGAQTTVVWRASDADAKRSHEYTAERCTGRASASAVRRSLRSRRLGTPLFGRPSVGFGSAPIASLSAAWHAAVWQAERRPRQYADRFALGGVARECLAGRSSASAVRRSLRSRRCGTPLFGRPIVGLGSAPIASLSAVWHANVWQVCKRIYRRACHAIAPQARRRKRHCAKRRIFGGVTRWVRSRRRRVCRGGR